MLSRLKNDLQGLNLAKPDVARASLQTKYPLNGDYLVEVRRLCERGVSEGWLCDGVANGARSSRIASPSKYFPFSIEAVELQGSGQGHGHPKGEVTLAWPLDGTPRFCGLDPGWST